MHQWYFDTSAVNFLAEHRSFSGGLATRNLQLTKGRDWRLSPVVLWEIMLTSEPEHRNRLIGFCQHAFSPELFPSPPELIVHFIEDGMPQVESPRALVSESRIASVWREICGNRADTLHFDQEELKGRTRSIQNMVRTSHQLIRSSDKLVSAGEEYAALDAELSRLVGSMQFVKSDRIIDPESMLLYKIALYFIMIMLCAEVDLDNEPIKRFWSRLRIDETRDRVIYAVQNLSRLVYRGPFAMMAMMAISQARGKYPRGVWFDALHAVYLTYADLLLTTDGHFAGLQQALPEPLLAERIRLVNEIDLIEVPVGPFGTAST